MIKAKTKETALLPWEKEPEDEDYFVCITNYCHFDDDSYGLFDYYHKSNPVDDLSGFGLGSSALIVSHENDL